MRNGPNHDEKKIVLSLKHDRESPTTSNKVCAQFGCVKSRLMHVEVDIHQVLTFFTYTASTFIVAQISLAKLLKMRIRARIDGNSLLQPQRTFVTSLSNTKTYQIKMKVLKS